MCTWDLLSIWNYQCMTSERMWIRAPCDTVRFWTACGWWHFSRTQKQWHTSESRYSWIYWETRVMEKVWGMERTGYQMHLCPSEKWFRTAFGHSSNVRSNQRIRASFCRSSGELLRVPKSSPTARDRQGNDHPRWSSLCWWTIGDTAIARILTFSLPFRLPWWLLPNLLP